MTTIIKHFCDICGKEISKDNPPWEPDLCPEHMIEYRKQNPQTKTYTSTSKNSDIKVWQ